MLDFLRVEGNMFSKAIDPDNHDYTMTINGEILGVVGVVTGDADDAEFVKYDATPYAGVDFITLPKTSATSLYRTLCGMVDTMVDEMDGNLDYHLEEIFGKETAEIIIDIGERLGFVKLKEGDKFYNRVVENIIDNDKKHATQCIQG